MKDLLRLWHELRHPGRLDGETRAELAHHVELAVAEKMRAGASEEDARRQARLELGNPESARELLRDGRAGSWL